MVAPAVEGIDLFKIAGRSISGWIPSLKTGSTLRQPFCSQLEERLLLWLEYHPLVASYARGDIGPQWALAYRLPIPKHAPAVALQEVWPWGEVASVEEVESRLAGQWPANGRQRYTLSRNILDVVGQAPWRIKYTQAFIVQRDVLDYMHPDNVHLRSGNGGEMDKKSCTF